MDITGNVAITVGPDFEYSLVKTNVGNLVMASDLVEKVMKLAEIEDYEVLKNF